MENESTNKLQLTMARESLFKNIKKTQGLLFVTMYLFSESVYKEIERLCLELNQEYDKFERYISPSLAFDESPIPTSKKVNLEEGIYLDILIQAIHKNTNYFKTLTLKEKEIIESNNQMHIPMQTEILRRFVIRILCDQSVRANFENKYLIPRINNHHMNKTLAQLKEINPYLRSITGDGRMPLSISLLDRYDFNKMLGFTTGYDRASKHYMPIINDLINERNTILVKMKYTQKREDNNRTPNDSEIQVIGNEYALAQCFKSGISKGKINYRALERRLMKRFPLGILGRRFLGDGKYTKIIISRLTRAKKIKLRK